MNRKELLDVAIYRRYFLFIVFTVVDLFCVSKDLDQRLFCGRCQQTAGARRRACALDASRKSKNLLLNVVVHIVVPDE